MREITGLADDREHGKHWQLLRGVFKRRAPRVVGVVVLVAIVVAVLFVLLNWYVAPTKPSERKDLVLALAQILAGTALLLGLYFTWRTLQVNREGQLTERFTRAIDQLGNKSLEIRLGGIYALERIARESEEDHWPIMEVLTAYVRKHAPWRPEEGQEGVADAAEVPVPEFPVPDLDIQAIMTVIRRRTRSVGHGEPEPLDLHDTNLSGANLRKANLSGAKLWNANLRRAKLLEANLRRAKLSLANLRKAQLLEANLSGAELWHANLSGADLWNANLSAADLGQADLSAADLGQANLSGAKLWNANLSGAELSEAELSEAEHLTQDQVEMTMYGDENTRLPPNLKPPEHWWHVKTDEQIEED